MPKPSRKTLDHTDDPLARREFPTSVQYQETNVGLDRDLWGSPVPPSKSHVPPASENNGEQSLGKLTDEQERRFQGSVHAAQWLPPPESDVERCFRHSGWLGNRIKVQDAFDRCGISNARKIRFSACGSACVVERSPSEKRLRVRACYCHDRWCLPCGRSRSGVICSNVKKLVEGKETRFITLTLRHSQGPLNEQLKRLLTCFRNLRQGKLWKSQVDGGCCFLELKRSKNGRSWHPHLHIICEGRYIAQSTLSTNWLSVTGDSSIVDIRFVRDNASVVQYVAKYASKPMDHSLFEREEWIDEALLAMRGKRLCTTFGSWRGKELEEHAADPGDWIPVCSLNELAKARTQNETWAIAMWAHLKRSNPDEVQKSPDDTGIG